MSLWRALVRPRRTLRAFEAARPGWAGLPWGTWVGLTAIAVGGSAVYGASLARMLPGWRPREGALWLALSAGAGWCVFGPGLIRVTGKHPFVCAQACMVTMAHGEGVLVTGVALNALLADRRRLPQLDRGQFNFAWVGVSNVVMAASLAGQLQTIGVPVWKTLATWMILLNGSGAGFFWVLARVLRREKSD